MNNEIVGLERIKAYLEKLFKDIDEPTLFQWASIVNVWETDNEYTDEDEV